MKSTARTAGTRGFAALHRRGQPFVLPNAWDVASALLLAEAGFPAVGTTSLRSSRNWPASLRGSEWPASTSRMPRPTAS